MHIYKSLVTFHHKPHLDVGLSHYVEQGDKVIGLQREILKRRNMASTVHPAEKRIEETKITEPKESYSLKPGVSIRPVIRLHVCYFVRWHAVSTVQVIRL